MKLDAAELLEAIDLLRAQRCKLSHAQILSDPDRAVGNIGASLSRID